MTSRQKGIWFTIFSGIVLLLAGSISSSYAQGTPVEFRGTWNTVTSRGKKIVLTLETVRRTSVSGTYARNGLTAIYQAPGGSVTAFVKVSAISAEPARQSLSSITGTVTDNVLRFKWLEDGGRGAGRFTMSPDGQSFQGTFSLTDNPDDSSGGTWNGTRAPVFAGAWQVKVGEQILYPDLLLYQTGNLVTGQLSANRAELGVIREGVIDGNTLRFKIWRARTTLPNAFPDLHVGNGELVMDKGSKSFKGTILNAATSGTRLGGRQ
ncbi:MAG TPA: hypothetical protein VNA17_02390 [Pyrinomonadaceae bacterium]|nr:hypothetical protein [Pyrinomonadaceae bacterium]